MVNEEALLTVGNRDLERKKRDTELNWALRNNKSPTSHRCGLEIGFKGVEAGEDMVEADKP